MIIEKVIR